jgi:hypothetical protein
MAGTVTAALTRIPTDIGRPKMAKVVLTCTADATAHTFPSTVLNTLLLAAGFDIRGMRINSVKVIPSAVTPPTNASSMTIKDEYGVDLMDEAGVTFIPAAGTAWTINSIFPAFITGDITLAITGNLVDSAVLTLVIELIGT